MNVRAAHLAADALWQIGGRVFQPTFWAILEGEGRGAAARKEAAEEAMMVGKAEGGASSPQRRRSRGEGRGG